MVNCGMHLLRDEIVDYLRFWQIDGESRVEGHLHSGFWKIRQKGQKISAESARVQGCENAV